MSILTAKSVGKSFGAEDIFGDITADIPHGARIALVGPNGAGKTTLLRILIGAEDPSAGTINRMKGLSIGYLPQRPDLLGSQTVWEEMLVAFTHLRNKEVELAELAHKMCDTARRAANEIIDRYGRLHENFE